MLEKGKAIQILMPISTSKLSETSKKAYECLQENFEADDECIGITFQTNGASVRILAIYKESTDDEHILAHLREGFSTFEKLHKHKIVGRLGRVPDIEAEVIPNGDDFVDFFTDPTTGMN